MKKPVENFSPGQIQELAGELQLRPRELQEVQERFHAVLDHSQHFLGLMRPDGTILEANRRSLNFMGRLRSDVVGKKLWETVLWEHTPPEEKTRARKSVEQAARGTLVRYEVQIQSATDGNPHIFEFSISPVRDTDGNVILLIPEGIDVTHRKAQERKLELAMQEAELANRAKSEFLAYMSHEIRTPLTAILGYTELLSDYGRTDEERTKYIAKIRQRSEHLSELINDILDLCGVESGKLKLRLAQVSPSGLIREVISSFRQQLTKTNTIIKSEVSPEIPNLILSDPIRLRQILQNVVGHVVRFTQAGTIEIKAHKKEDILYLTVSDNGSGLSEVYKNSLFDPFEITARNPAGIKGSSLGLPLSRKLCQFLGGDLKLTTNTGEGSTFIISISLNSSNFMNGSGLKSVSGGSEKRKSP